MLDIRDREGCISKLALRRYFEGAITQTPALAHLPLKAVEIRGHFNHYEDPRIDNLWVGFALGMRCHERVMKANSISSPARCAPQGGALPAPGIAGVDGSGADGDHGDTTTLDQYRNMFHAACADLGVISDALGIDPEEGGAEPILDAIAELKEQIRTKEKA